MRHLPRSADLKQCLAPDAGALPLIKPLTLAHPSILVRRDRTGVNPDLGGVCHLCK
jgi:hypothetical protein